MTSYNSDNERIKAKYFDYLRTAGRKSDKTTEQARKAIIRYEAFTDYASFKAFSKETAIAYKQHLSKAQAVASGEALKAGTLRNLICPLINFFTWLAFHPEYKKYINHHDIKYLELSENESRANHLADFKEFPTIDIIETCVRNYPTVTEIDKRDRAMMAFTALTGIRDDALCSLKLRHFDPNRGIIKQYASDGVKTKFRKNFTTGYFPLSPYLETVYK